MEYQVVWVTSWNQHFWKKYQQTQMYRWHHSNARNWRGTRVSLFFNLFILIKREITTLWFFCHISTWIGHRYTCVSPDFNPLWPPPYPPYPSRLSQSTGFGCPASCIKLTLVIYVTYGKSIYFNAVLSNHPTLAFSDWVQKSVVYVFVSLAALHIGSSILSF